jgi:5-methyltetrahydrofolate--homocysteine methyltransferase
MTFNRTKLGFFTLMGNPALFSLKALESAGADAVGSNCSLVPSDMLDLLAEVKDKVSIPLIMQPNAGVPEVVGEEVVYRISSEEYAAGVVKLAGAGAEIVGGCCGSTPEMIGLVAKALRN